MGLYMVSFISCATTFVFLAAIALKLCRNTPEAIEYRRQYQAKEITQREYQVGLSSEKHRIVNISWAWTMVGYFLGLCLAVSILRPLWTNPKADNYTIVLVNSFWVLLGVWWFIFQKPRPGPPLPKGKHYLTLGVTRMWEALRQYRRLPYTFIYLFGYFLMADAYNTTLTLVFLCQNRSYSFSFLKQSYLGFAQSSTSVISISAFLYIHKRWKVDAKKLFVITCVTTTLVPLWGMLGIWNNRFGLRNIWEYWAVCAFTGLLQAPFLSFSQSIMSELCPPSFEYLFFGLFGISNRASSVIGPNVIQKIIDNSNGNLWMGFPFLFALAAVATLIISFGVDMEKGRIDAATFTMEHQPDEPRGTVIGALNPGTNEAGEMEEK